MAPGAGSGSETAPTLATARTHSIDAGAAPIPTAPSAAAPPIRRPPTDAPRVFAKTRNVWIRGNASSRDQWIGFLWIGNSVKLRSTEPVKGPGCETWYAIEPRGYVCVDGDRASLDAQDPVIEQLYALAPNPDRANPHPFYGESLDAQRYHELPTERQQAAREWDYRLRKGHIRDALAGSKLHASLAGVDLEPAKARELQLPPLPRTLRMGRKRLIRRSTVAWTREIRHEERDFLLTDDFTWVPKDRVVPYQPVSFQGLWLGENPPAGMPQAKLPLVFFRGKKSIKYQRGGNDEFIASDDFYPHLGWSSLTGKKERVKRKTFYETKDGFWVHSDDAVVPSPRDKTPWGAPVFGADETKLTPEGRQTWVDVSVLGGWLLAYEGTQPVFATMMSPGRGGPPQGKKDPVETASTPTGWFKITGKFFTSTMVAPNELVHNAVPWAQNFSGPHALHGAYWHDDWGKLKSGGCVNVSPADGRFLFAFTEPKIPEGWHGVRWLPDKEPATTFIVKR